ncbi:MAG: hypothetical protein OXC38_03220 [Gammaproteobacteria bacterium]|nr:hypothetical protein [Gammaproteobacteria bacterium]
MPLPPPPLEIDFLVASTNVDKFDAVAENHVAHPDITSREFIQNSLGTHAPDVRVALQMEKPFRVASKISVLTKIQNFWMLRSVNQHTDITNKSKLRSQA